MVQVHSEQGTDMVCMKQQEEVGQLTLLLFVRLKKQEAAMIALCRTSFPVVTGIELGWERGHNDLPLWASCARTEGEPNGRKHSIPRGLPAALDTFDD